MATGTKQAKATHQPLPWPKIQAAYEAGLSMQKIADKFGKYNAKSDDPLKEIRGICSRGKTIGYTNNDGKLVKFNSKLRDKAIEAAGGKPYGSGPKKQKAQKTVKQQKAPKVAKVAKTTKTGKAVLIALEEGGKFVRLTINKQPSLLPVAEFLHAAQDIVNQLGYTVEKTEVAELPMEETVTIVAGGETVQAPEAEPEVQAPVAEPEAAPVAEPVIEQVEAPEPVEVA